MIIWGWNPVIEALRSHADRLRWIGVAKRHGERVQRLVGEARRAGVTVRILDHGRIDHLAPGQVHNGVVAELSEKGYADFDDEIGRPGLDLVFLLDGVEDPSNVGAILRVADAFGTGLLVIPRHQSAGLTPVAVKTSAGASEWVPVAEVTNLARAIDQLKQHGFWVYATELDGERLEAVDFPARVAVVFGSEGKGIRRNVVAHCDARIAIPMHGRIASLNVATAAAVVGWEIARKRTK